MEDQIYGDVALKPFRRFFTIWDKNGATFPLSSSLSPTASQRIMASDGAAGFISNWIEASEGNEARFSGLSV